MSTQIFLASTLYGTATLAAALDEGCFAPADRRILLVCNNAVTPETTPALDEMPGFERLRSRFDDVVSWNEAIFPFHPGGWSPRVEDAPLWERHLRLLWDLGEDDVALAVESIQVHPALGVAQIFTDAPLTVYADGLMSYGPTRNKLDPLVGTRVERLLHLDLVPGLAPLLLTEFDVPARIVPTPAFTKVLAELADTDAALPGGEGSALLLGQYLSALGILTAEEEEDLHVRMLTGAVGLGHSRVVFKPHPTAPARFTRTLEQEAEKLGVELTVLDTPVLAEVLYRRMRPALVVGCFSTALLTASALYGLPVARVGTETLLDRLTPYENSNRVPVTIVDALLPEPADRDAVAEGRRGLGTEALAALVRAVGYAMQPKILPELRPAAEEFLRTGLDARTRRYFKKRRLTSLGLPGGVPERLAFLPRNAAARRVVRRARAIRRSIKR
ncbi:alpha-2,8-polysialyltransferase family protein [Streptomyces anthocyanicus]|uniref:alpha-2,8-polysialyltransferase family protein n=1 Tax=Streptomyces TaxID=1883 RepID=UPI0029B13A5B|nr:MULTISPECIES: alpha-2,8-polysialyltransferase family protein [Streptomyces]MDX3370777.1 alpha-2,8-polysialyltransferase family protein [Streptomyces sp. ME02-6987-2C]MDX3424931.1 alpha-2,8-polysialyltransferase family protein [Streptomyces sp. ME02-6985-2c]WSB61264.1 alpha-2,8-polysialyltransferase family protein [Streptomyces anthocyanicus]